MASPCPRYRRRFRRHPARILTGPAAPRTCPEDNRRRFRPRHLRRFRRHDRGDGSTWAAGKVNWEEVTSAGFRQIFNGSGFAVGFGSQKFSQIPGSSMATTTGDRATEKVNRPPYTRARGQKLHTVRICATGLAVCLIAILCGFPARFF